MGDEKNVKDKMRIVRRDDSKLFVWSPALDARADMRAGYLYIYEDGSRDCILDRATRQELDTRTVSQRERGLIDENADLRNRVAELEGLPPLGGQHTSLAPGESPIGPLAPDQVIDLTNPAPADEESIELARPEFYTPSKLQTMHKPDLASHARSFAPDLEIPDEMLKDDLVALCLDLQEKAVGE